MKIFVAVRLPTHCGRIMKVQLEITHVYFNIIDFLFSDAHGIKDVALYANVYLSSIMETLI